MEKYFVMGIILWHDYAMLLKDEKENFYLPEFEVQGVSDLKHEQPFLDSFCEGIRETLGFKRSHMMFQGDLGTTHITKNGKKVTLKLLIFKIFFYELPEQYKGKNIEWVNLRNLHKFITDKEISNFCEYKSTQIYNAKYDMKNTRPTYPSKGIR
ncbi:MAG: hypothetical protein ACOCQX_00975 [Candidatus Nanoarchaeia archaeon]